MDVHRVVVILLAACDAEPAPAQAVPRRGDLHDDVHAEHVHLRLLAPRRRPRDRRRCAAGIQNEIRESFPTGRACG
jgi:hypothetical protein